MGGRNPARRAGAVQQNSEHRRAKKRTDSTTQLERVWGKNKRILRKGVTSKKRNLRNGHERIRKMMFPSTKPQEKSALRGRITG